MVRNVTRRAMEGKESMEGHPDASSAHPNAASSVVKRRRWQVECAMAWELNGILCGLVPIDGDHVGILSLVPVGVVDPPRGEDRRRTLQGERRGVGRGRVKELKMSTTTTPKRTMLVPKNRTME